MQTIAIHMHLRKPGEYSLQCGAAVQGKIAGKPTEPELPHWTLLHESRDCEEGKEHIANKAIETRPRQFALTHQLGKNASQVAQAFEAMVQ